MHAKRSQGMLLQDHPTAFQTSPPLDFENNTGSTGQGNETHSDKRFTNVCDHQ
jgi:hypothetical protein